MISTLAMLVVSAPTLFPVGYEIDCKSWPGVIRTKLTVTVIATDASENVGRMDLSRDWEVLDAQIAFQLALDEQPGWVVRVVPDHKVQVFAPKGTAMKSIKFESTGWVPVYRRVFVRPEVKPKK